MASFVNAWLEKNAKILYQAWQGDDNLAPNQSLQIRLDEEFFNAEKESAKRGVRLIEDQCY